MNEPQRLSAEELGRIRDNVALAVRMGPDFLRRENIPRLLDHIAALEASERLLEKQIRDMGEKWDEEVVRLRQQIDGMSRVYEVQSSALDRQATALEAADALERESVGLGKLNRRYKFQPTQTEIVLKAAATYRAARRDEGEDTTGTPRQS